MSDAKLTPSEKWDTTAVDRRSWFALGICALGAAIGSISQAVAPSWANVAAMALAIAGLIGVGQAIARKPRNIFVLMLGVCAALLAYAATHSSWDSAHVLFLVMAGVAVFAIVVLLLPRPLQMAVVSALVVFHFCGEMSAITSPQPQTWLSNWSWVTLFRPHLVFCYTNNAYQFYSPDPGPASLLWFCVELNDGTKTWYKLPRKPETHLDPLSVQFFRRLSMTEAANQNLTLPSIPPDVLQSRNRMLHQFPLHPELPLSAQYFVPQPFTRRTISSYARHVALEFGGCEQVKSIRIYRVLHRMLDARQFAAGERPYGESTYLPFYLGEFDCQGVLQNVSDDPMLYWLIPIYRGAAVVTPMTRSGQESVENCLMRHAGSDPFADRPGTAP